jgi:hypothetical protein
VTKRMGKRIDPAVELAARTIQSEPWDLSQWWEPLVFMAVDAKHECCFRGWSEPYPGLVGDRMNFVCGECNHRGPIERVPNLRTGAVETRKAFGLGSCPHDPWCNGERLKSVSCASVLADHVNEFCDRLDRTLAPDSDGSISWEKAQEAYWAFGHFKKHLPDWDPTGAYDGAFERWEEECARERIPPWGPGGPPRPVPLVDRIRQERREALTGAQCAYEKTMAPAQEALALALAEADRVQGEAKVRLYRHKREEIQRLLSEPHKVNRRLVARTRAAQWAAQQEANREARETQILPSRHSRPRPGGNPPGGSATNPPPLSEEMAAYIHLSATIQCAYEKAEAAALRAYGRSAVRAERAYQKALAGPEPASGVSATVSADWDILAQLAERLTELGERVDKAIGRFSVIDVTANREEVIRQKEDRKAGLGLRKRPAPPRSIGGPRDPVKYARFRELERTGMPAKQIAGKIGASLQTVYRWRKVP